MAKSTEYTDRIIAAWEAGQALQVRGNHRNEPQLKITRLSTDGVTIFSYGEPIVTKHAGVILLNLTPYVISASQRGVRGGGLKLSTVTIGHQSQIATYLYARPALRNRTYVFDYYPRGRYYVNNLTGHYDTAIKRGYDLTTLYDYVHDDYYSVAVRSARAEAGQRTTPTMHYHIIQAFTYVVVDGQRRQVNVETGEVVPTVAELLAASAS